MVKISRRRLHFVTAGFLAEMRKNFTRVRPGEECPIKSLEDYSPEHRSALMAAVEKAMTLASGDADKFFVLWEERQVDTTGDYDK